MKPLESMKIDYVKNTLNSSLMMTESSENEPVEPVESVEPEAGVQFAVEPEVNQGWCCVREQIVMVLVDRVATTTTMPPSQPSHSPNPRGRSGSTN